MLRYSRLEPEARRLPQAAEDYRRDIYRQYTKQTTRNEHVSVVRRIVTETHRVGLISALRRDQVLDQLFTIAPGPSSRRRRGP